MTEEALVIIDAAGDVLLELPDGARGKARLRVSSKALSLASPVLDRMFQSRFREGLATARLSPEMPVVTLPEDDVEVMAVLCNVVHHRMEDVPRCLSVACLEKMAMAADKYDCVTALTHSSIVWLQAGLEAYVPKDWIKLVHAAYILDIPTAFARTSWEVIIAKKGPLNKLVVPFAPDLIKHNLSSMLRTINFFIFAVNGATIFADKLQFCWMLGDCELSWP
jgi:hypothetical protein